MATPSGPGPSETPAAPSHSALGKYVKRISSVFKKDRPVLSTPPTAATIPTTTTATTPAPTSAPATTPATPATPAAPSSPPLAPALAHTHLAPARASTTVTTPVTTPVTSLITTPTRHLNRSAMQQERARTLFAKYGLTLESHEWITTPSPFPTVQRVEKAVRMRLHRSCHRCGTVYGQDKLCDKCEHRRCKKCPRYPKKKASEPKPETTTHVDAMVVAATTAQAAANKSKRMTLLSMTTRSAAHLAHHPPRQRVRRICHKCNALFVPPTATACDQCHHTRCTKCPREPAKLAKWPTGYPGDADANSDSEMEKQLDKFRRTWRKPRARVRWECEQCQSVFLNGSPHCPGCGHERCEQCTRSPAKKIKKEEQFDPLIVAAVEAKLRALAVGDDTTSSAEGI